MYLVTVRNRALMDIYSTFVISGDDCNDDQDDDGTTNQNDNCPLVKNLDQKHEKRTYDVKGKISGC